MSRPRLRDQHGVTLVELLTTAALLAVFMSVLASSAILAQRTAADSGRSLDDLGQARVAVAAAGRALRMAVRVPGVTSPFVSRSPSSVEFYANVDVSATSGPRKVRLFLQGTSLMESVTPATSSGGSWTWNQADARERTLATNVATTAPFTFHCGPAICADSADGSAITAVGLRLRVTDPANAGVAPTELRTMVRVANFTYVPPSG